MLKQKTKLTSHKRGWVRDRNENGEYGWRNLQTWQFTTKNPLTGELQSTESTIKQTMLRLPFDSSTLKGRILIALHEADSYNKKNYRPKTTNEMARIHPQYTSKAVVTLDLSGEPVILVSQQLQQGPGGLVSVGNTPFTLPFVFLNTIFGGDIELDGQELIDLGIGTFPFGKALRSGYMLLPQTVKQAAPTGFKNWMLNAELKEFTPTITGTIESTVEPKIITTKPSNLTPEQLRLVRTPEFKRWFGDWENDPTHASKVLDENGEPAIVYHGTEDDFNTFDFQFFGKTDPGDRGMGFYFSPKLSTAEMYGDKIMPVFLNIRNPYTGVYERYLNRRTENEVRDMLLKLRDFQIKDNVRAVKTSLEFFKRDFSLEEIISGEGFKSPAMERAGVEYTDDLETMISKFTKDYDKLHPNLLLEVDQLVGNFANTDGYISNYENVIYNPNQAKSAIKNNGNFSLDSNNIYEWQPKNLDYVHQSSTVDLARDGKLTDDFYGHTFDFNTGDINRYSEISDYVAPIEKDLYSLNSSLYDEILQNNADLGYISLSEVPNRSYSFSTAKNSIANYSNLPPAMLQKVILTILPDVSNFNIGNDGRIWGNFQVGLKWKGVNVPFKNGTSLQYITDARNSPATIAIHEGGHGIQRDVMNMNHIFDPSVWAKTPELTAFIESLSPKEMKLFLNEPHTVQQLLYDYRDLIKDVPINEITNVARDIRGMLVSKGVKTTEQLRTHINSLSDAEINSLYPQTNYLLKMRTSTDDPKRSADFLRKLVTGTAFGIAAILSQHNSDIN